MLPKFADDASERIAQQFRDEIAMGGGSPFTLRTPTQFTKETDKLHRTARGHAMRCMVQTPR